MNSRHLVDRFADGRAAGESMVLVTVVDTLGSTYSKAGSRMLIMASGENQGLVSGGCLESDLAERARALAGTGAAAVVTYDLRDEADELFGLGIGCNGLIRVMLQRLTPEAGYEPMASIAEALLSDAGGMLTTIVESELKGLDVGASLVEVGGTERRFGLDASLASELAPGARQARDSRRCVLVTVADRFKVLYSPLDPIPRILILGAGLDAVPLVNVLAELGWRVFVADHRPAYLARAGFERAESSLPVEPARLAGSIELDAFDAIVVMSHHLATDLAYLRQLASCSAPYIGVLGPPARRRRLLDELGATAAGLASRLRGPVGLDIGADSAESIAVSIAAEMQSILSTAA
jgi:xanthine/CO dehydrogenase XdhC/CoxF family maturation factor